MSVAARRTSQMPGVALYPQPFKEVIPMHKFLAPSGKTLAALVASLAATAFSTLSIPGAR